MLIKHKFKMKKIIVLFALFVSTYNASAQTVEIKSNPIGFAFGASNLSVEYALPQTPSITLNASAWHYTSELQDWLDMDRNGGASIGLRKYVLSRDDRGVYMGIASRYINSDRTYYSYNTTSGQHTPEELDNSYGSLGCTLGYKFVFNDKVTIDVFAGVARKLFQNNPYSWQAPGEVMSGFNFGYRF